MATKKKPAKKGTAKKAASTSKAPAKKKAAAKKAAAKKSGAKKATATKAAAKKAPAKGASAKKTTKKAAAKKAPAKKTTKKAAAKKPVKSPFGQKFIDAQEATLIKERARYVNSAQTWKAEADSLLEGREPGDVQFDEESGEGDTLAIERERDLALSSHARAAVEEIDEALARLKAGTYGVCVTSGKAIPKERLEAIPWAAERVEVKVAGFRRR
jgi:RNA polymerase-binding transcription factor DksA